MVCPEAEKPGWEKCLMMCHLHGEPGLYGEVSGFYGGYNLESKEFRGVAYASCEFYGQDMLINYTSPVKGRCLYHLVFDR